MLGPLSGQYRATLARFCLTQLDAAKLWASFLGGAYFCGLWKTCNFFLYIYNAKPFIALSDVKSTGCLQQCHATEGRPTWPIWDTVEPGPHLSLCPPPLHIFCIHPPPAGQQPAQPFTSFFAVSLLWFRDLNYHQVFFSSRESYCLMPCIHPSLSTSNQSDLLASEPWQQYIVLCKSPPWGGKPHC